MEEHDFMGVVTITTGCKKCGISFESYLDNVFVLRDLLPNLSCYGKMMFSCCNGKGAATWDTPNGQWKCSDCGAPQSNDPDYLGGGFIPKIDFNKFKSVDVCQCGADVVYGKGNNMHSATMPCPLYRKP